MNSYHRGPVFNIFSPQCSISLHLTWSSVKKCVADGDIAQWQSIRLQIERSLVRSRVSPSSFVFEKHILLVMSYLDLFFNIWIECVHDNSIVRQQKQSFGDIGIRTRGLSHAKRALYHWAISPLLNKCFWQINQLLFSEVLETSCNLK